MTRRASCIPDVVPEGTKYIVEFANTPGYVHRFVEFPDGRTLDLGIGRMASAPNEPPKTARRRGKHRDPRRSSGDTRPERFRGVARRKHAAEGR